MYVTWYYCELHDLIKFLCAQNKDIRTIYFSEAPRMKKYFKLGMCLKIAKKKKLFRVNVDNDDAAAADDDGDYYYIYLIIIL